MAPAKIRLEADFWSPAGELKLALGDGAMTGLRVVLDCFEVKGLKKGGLFTGS